MEQKRFIRKYDIYFTFSGNLDNNIKTYQQICKLCKILDTNIEKSVLLDFYKVEFISANLFAALGACLDYTIKKNHHEIYVSRLNKKIKQLIARNGFNRYFDFDSEEDSFKNSIKYEIFEANTEQLTVFERYLTLYIFEHNDIPKMSKHYRYKIIDNFLEIFNNVIDHAESEKVYVCGQFFYKSKNLKFSIVDIGQTFVNKIIKYFNNIGKEPPQKCIEWAIMSGNSTKTDAPGGIGLTILMEFLKYNGGSFTIVSGNECYEYSSKGERTQEIYPYFPGTIVTIGISLTDDNLYLYDDENEETIIF